MDYEKKYKEALEKARCYYVGANGKEDMITMTTTIFHELKEIEDERIRKELIKETKGSEVRLFETVTNDEFVAWLEKHSSSQTKE